MRDRGHQVRILVGGDGVFRDKAHERGLETIGLKFMVYKPSPWRDIRALFELMGHLRRSRPDLIHAHSSKAGFLGRIAARVSNIPSVFTAHGWAFADGVKPWRRRMALLLERLAGPISNKIITVSHYDYDLAVRLRVASPSRMVCIHNGVPEGSLTHRASPSDSPPKIVMVARFDLQKDPFGLIDALGLLPGLSWSCDFVGEGPLLESARRRAAELGLSDRVRFLGHSDQVEAVLQESQIFTLVTHWEGLPLSIIEAMRAGLPVIASDVGGVNELIEDYDTGFLIPKEDVQALASRLSLLIKDPTLRSRLGVAGRRRFENHFSMGRMIDRTEAVYHEVVERKPVND